MRYSELWICYILIKAYPWDLSQFSRPLKLRRWHSIGFGWGAGDGGKASAHFQLGLVLHPDPWGHVLTKVLQGHHLGHRTEGEPWAVVSAVVFNPTFHSQPQSRIPASVMPEPVLAFGLCWRLSPRMSGKPWLCQVQGRWLTLVINFEFMKHIISETFPWRSQVNLLSTGSILRFLIGE